MFMDVYHCKFANPSINQGYNLFNRIGLLGLSTGRLS